MIKFKVNGCIEHLKYNSGELTLVSKERKTEIVRISTKELEENDNEGLCQLFDKKLNKRYKLSGLDTLVNNEAKGFHTEFYVRLFK